MKQKRRGLIFLMVVLLLPTISAVDIILTKQEYSFRETLQAEITGNFISLENKNLLIYKEGIPRSDPVIKDLIKKNNKYYFYAILPNKEGNYSLRIEDAEYIDSGKISEKTIIKNFTIKDKGTTLSINPGFVITSNKIKIRVKSIGGNLNVNAVVEETGESQTLSLTEEIEDFFEFSLSDINSTFTNIKIGSYNIPIFIIQEKEEPKLEEVILEFMPVQLSGIIVFEKNYYFNIILKNSGKENLTNIILSNDFNAEVYPDKISYLESGKSIKINISMFSGDKDLTGSISATHNDNSFNLPVFFNLTTNQEEVSINETNINEIIETLSCEGMGKICLENQYCDGETIASSEGVCCLGVCINLEDEEESNNSWIIGLILLAVLVFIITIFYIRARKKGRPKSASEILKSRSGRYENRMKGNTDEVKKKLDTV